MTYQSSVQFSDIHTFRKSFDHHLFIPIAYDENIIWWEYTNTSTSLTTPTVHLALLQLSNSWLLLEYRWVPAFRKFHQLYHSKMLNLGKSSFFDLSGTVHSSKRYLMFLNCMTLQNENTSERWRMVGSPTPIYTTNPSRPVSIVGCVFVVVVCLYVCCIVCFVYCLSRLFSCCHPRENLQVVL